MKTNCFIVSILLLLLVSCSQNQQNRSKDIGDNNNQLHDTAVKKDENTGRSGGIRNDTTLLFLGDSMVKLLKNRDYTRLTQFIHPQSGIRFSPYGIVDSLKNKTLSASQIMELANNKKTIKWGTFEGTGEPIKLTINDYFKRFVYDVDFMNAEKKSINRIIGPDSSLSNIKAFYPDGDFVQYYFSGFIKQYEGMDWKSLVLVFKKTDTKTFLISIIHNQWKI
ncbi:MAG: hypothetical protein ACR2KZ_18005 [Segetibacter sp.]